MSEPLHVEVAAMGEDEDRYFYGRLIKREYGIIKTTVWICNHEHTSYEDARVCARGERERRKGK